MGNWHSNSENMNEKNHAFWAVAMFKQKWGEHVGYQNFTWNLIKILVSYMSSPFLLYVHNLSWRQKEQATLCREMLEILQKPTMFPNTYLMN